MGTVHESSSENFHRAAVKTCDSAGMKIRRAWLDRQWYNKVAQQVVVVGHGKTFGLLRILLCLQTADWQIS